MNFEAGLAKIAQRHRRAKREIALLEARRDALIRQAHREGGLTVREIAEPLGLSFQRIASVIAGGKNHPARSTLHGAMEQVLKEGGGGWMATHDLARSIYRRGLYRRRDGGVIHPAQVRARAAAYRHLFTGSTDGSSRIRLNTDATSGYGQ